MYGFDKGRAWRAALRYCARLAVPAALALSVLAFTTGDDGAPENAASAVVAVAVGLLLFGGVPALASAEGMLTNARALHLYGRRVRAELQAKPPVLTRLLGLARVTVETGDEDGGKPAWCFGMPWQFADLDVGDRLQLVRDMRAGKGGTWLRLPFWTDTRPETEVERVGQAILTGLGNVLRPLEGDLEHISSRVERQGKLAGCGAFVLGLVVAAGFGIAGLGLVTAFAGPFVAVYIVQKANEGSRRRAVDAAVERFGDTFPAAGREGQAALMFLAEDKKPTPAWGELRKVLIDPA
jgi:hypothetical protein